MMYDGFEEENTMMGLRQAGFYVLSSILYKEKRTYGVLCLT